MTINRVQELQFELMKEASFNDFDGNLVVNSLKENEDLWEGAVFDRAGLSTTDTKPYSEVIDLIKLRDIGDGYWNVDTLYMLPKFGKKNELENLARQWSADEIDWIEGDIVGKLLGSYGGTNQGILRVWWD